MTTSFQDKNPKGPNNLKQTEAAFRANQISNVRYVLNLSLTKGSDQYQGDIAIKFDYTPSENPEEKIFLDFSGHTIESMTVNGRSIISSDGIWVENRLLLAGFLTKGPCVVTIFYKNFFQHSGDGFHQFIDPEDHQEYVYTNFEPYEAHRLLPCFDQPNIKAELTLSVTAPKDWKVIANSAAIKVDHTEGGQRHSFRATPHISSYLFAVVAGPYDVFEDNYDGRVPLGIYVRKSLKKYLDADNIFLQTKQGLGFYESFFEFKYPFDKYDQIFVPEFNMGAMENVGCVTFTESYVFKDPPTRSQQAARADTILHEMAHMWFGNLVTPVWWNGLWLNESFATYMAALCVSEATEFGGLSWLIFNSSMKQGAYREDQLSTTHPIEGPVIDTDATALIFDGITYGKGASLLKQLVYVVGMENFKSGMRYYFKRYAWGNTTIAQFLEALATAAGSRLDPTAWSREWLETAGLNTLSLELVPDGGGKVAQARVVQTAPAEYPTLRHHAAEVVVYDYDGTALKLRETVQISVKNVAENPLEYLVGKPRPAFVYINYNDHAFAKCPLDPMSLSFVVDHMDLITSSLLRQLLWTGLYDLTRDAKMKATDYLKLVSTKISIETDPKLVQTILSRAIAALSHFIPNEQYHSQADILFWAVFANLEKATQADCKIVWARYSVEAARTEKSIGVLAELLRKDNPVFTQELRWAILHRMASWNLEGVQELIAKEQERDKSDIGARAVLKAGTCFPKPEVKSQAWERFLNPESKLSTHQVAAEMSGFRWFHQEKLLAPYIEKFFSSLSSVFKTRDREFSSSFFGYLFPADPENPEIIARAKTLLGQLSEEEKHLKKTLKVQVDDLERELKCRKFVLGIL